MNSQREEELKPLPCPFCGNKPEWEYHKDPAYPQVECRNIECPIGMANDQVSLESWNTRQAATEQGVGKDGYSVEADLYETQKALSAAEAKIEEYEGFFTGEDGDDHGGDAKAIINDYLRTHPPKPTGGGVPDEVMARIKNLLLALGHQGVTLNPDEPPYDVGEWGIKEAQELCDLLATQQPPEPSTEVKRSRLYEIAEYLRGIGNTADASHVENCAVAMQTLRDEYREFTRQPIDSEGGHHD